MVMKIKGTMENFEAKKQAYMNLVKAEDTKWRIYLLHLMICLILL